MLQELLSGCAKISSRYFSCHLHFFAVVTCKGFGSTSFHQKKYWVSLIEASGCGYGHFLIVEQASISVGEVYELGDCEEFLQARWRP